MRALALLVPFLFLGCSGLPRVNGDAGATDGGAKSDAAAAVSGDGGSVKGLNCGKDPATGVTLCLGVSTCPTSQVDPDVFPACGFRVDGAKYDLVCLCDNQLCPVGPVVRCADIGTLLASQSVISVCNQANDGRCVPAR
jgi:hypothetical protein